MCVNKKPQSETGNKRLREPHKTRSAKRTSAAEQKREQRTHAAPKNSSSLLSSWLVTKMLRVLEHGSAFLRLMDLWLTDEETRTSHRPVNQTAWPEVPPCKFITFYSFDLVECCLALHPLDGAQTPSVFQTWFMVYTCQPAVHTFRHDQRHSYTTIINKGH